MIAEKITHHPEQSAFKILDDIQGSCYPHRVQWGKSDRDYWRSLPSHDGCLIILNGCQ